MSEQRLRAGLIAVGVLLIAGPWLSAQETVPVGTTPEDQQRNAGLLSGYEYGKYSSALTGYTGQDRQRIAVLEWRHAVRTRVGSRGNYKAGMTQLPNGTLVLATCRNNNDPDPKKRHFDILVYESKDLGLTWAKIGKTPLFGKEPSLTALPDGSLVLTTQLGIFAPGWRTNRDMQKVPISRSTDGGRTWETIMLPGFDYPRNLIVEPDGSLLMVRALATGWLPNGSTKMQLCRSSDGGKTWQCSEGHIDWDYTVFGEVSAIHLKNGRLLATLRRQIPGTNHEGFQDTVITESLDNGEHWSKPRSILNAAEVHTYLTKLADGRILATYSNYHLPWGVYAALSSDGGKTFDTNHPIQLALSADIYVGWPVTLQLEDGSLITSYASTTYLKQVPDKFTTETVRWRLPPANSE
jgi:hypothetical protein